MEESKRITIEDAYRVISEIDDAKYEQVAVGRNNWVFLSENTCISIPKNPNKVQYGIRAAAMNYLMKNNIPTTELIDHGFNQGIEYIITKRINAQNINLNSLSPNMQLKIHEQCASVIHEVHKLNMSGYGRLTEKMEGQYKTWNEFVNEFFESAMRRLYSTVSLKERFSRKLIERFSTMNELLNTPKTAFLHGDYHLGNLLFEEDKLRALIDLDIVMSGDIYWDLGHYMRTFKGDRLAGKNAFIQAYGEWNEDRANFYAMIIWTRKLASQGESRPDALTESVQEMERILKWST